MVAAAPCMALDVYARFAMMVITKNLSLLIKRYVFVLFLAELAGF
jgi:hypothetical protein